MTKLLPDKRRSPVYHVLIRTEFVPDGCWLFHGSINNCGYGQVGRNKAWGKPRTVLAHRVMYEATLGPIPEGMTVDHLCRVRNCVNPEHLEAVSIGENVRRAAAARRKERAA